jgi:prolyl-tRNA editing enzyme YbaK/EbsC (Cys-tRNA(Pro) deacylase)
MTTRSKPDPFPALVDDNEDTLDEVRAMIDELTEPAIPHLMSDEERSPPADEDLTISFFRQGARAARALPPSPLDRVTRYLRANATRHTVRRGPIAWTEQEIVELEDRGSPVVRTVLTRFDQGHFLCVLPEYARLDLVLLQMLLGAVRSSYVPLDDVEALCPGFDPAHLPPLGALVGHPVLLSARLEHGAHLSFRLSPHAEIVTMNTADFLRLPQAHVIQMT